MKQPEGLSERRSAVPLHLTVSWRRTTNARSAWRSPPAAIAAVHADAPTADATDWAQIVALYDQLYAQSPNPVVRLNRAIAISELHGLAEGLVALDALDADRLAEYQPYHATRADLLARSGRTGETIDAYNRAIELTTNPTERRFLINPTQRTPRQHANRSSTSGPR